MKTESFVKINNLDIHLDYYIPVQVKEYNDDINKQLDEFVESGIKECNEFINDYNLQQDKKYNEKSFIYKMFNKPHKFTYTGARLKELIQYGIDYYMIANHCRYDYYNKFSKIIYDLHIKYNKLQYLKINECQLNNIMSLTKYGTEIYLCQSDLLFIKDVKNKINYFLTKKDHG